MLAIVSAMPIEPEFAHFLPAFKSVFDRKCFQFFLWQKLAIDFYNVIPLRQKHGDHIDLGADRPADQFAVFGPHAGVKLQFFAGPRMPRPVAADRLDLSPRQNRFDKLALKAIGNHWSNTPARATWAVGVSFARAIIGQHIADHEDVRGGV